MSEIIIFVGPTLPVEQARSVLDATYLPPAAMGDVYRVLALRPQAIGIIDGYFEQTPAVWHKELLLAISRGIRVYGASSMGALRAAELDTFGMIGVGSIYERFRDDVLTDDDEVAVTHGPAEMGYRTLSAPMVNLRDGLALAARANVISPDVHHELIRLAKRRFYPERSYPTLFADARAAGMSVEVLDRLRTFVADNAPDTKRDDAILLLKRMAEDRALGFPGQHPGFRFNASPFMFTLLIDSAAPNSEVTHPSTRHRSSGASFGRMVRTTHAEQEALFAECLMRFLLSSEAVATGAFEDWIEAIEALGSPGLLAGDETALERAKQARDGIVSRLRALYGSRLDVFLPAVLADRGELGPAMEQQAEVWRNALAQGQDSPTPRTLGVTPMELLAWYTRRTGPLKGLPHEHAERLGMSLDEFLVEVSALYLREQSVQVAPSSDAGKLDRSDKPSRT